MQKIWLYVLLGVLFISCTLLLLTGHLSSSSTELQSDNSPDYLETEAGFTEAEDINLADLTDEELRRLVAEETALIPYEREDGRIRWSQYWGPFTEAEAELYGRVVREPGPIKIGVQVGHWKNDQVPEELSGLTQNGGGAQGGGFSEVETVKTIAERLVALLEAEGMEAELLPATIPIDYYADAFVSIHADGNNNSTVRGFKIASPRYDYPDRSEALVEHLYEAYEAGTGLPVDDNITRRMSGYYAFNWRRYEHALHPMTPAAIVETGFMTSPADRAVIVSNPDKVAQAIADGLMAFFEAFPLEGNWLEIK